MTLLASMNTALTCTYHPIGRIKSKNESFLRRQFLPNVSTFQLTHFSKTRLSNQGAIESSLDKFCKIQEGQNQQNTHEANHLGFLVHNLEHRNMLYSMSSMYKRRCSAGLWRKTLSFSTISPSGDLQRYQSVVWTGRQHRGQATHSHCFLIHSTNMQ